MQLDIQSRSFPMTESIRAHVERRLHFALDRVTDRITDVTVRLSDVNGPRGGVDKQFGVLVRLVDGRVVVVRDTDSCAYTAVDRATTRVKRLVKDHLRRHSDRRRRRSTIRHASAGRGEREDDAGAVVPAA